MITSVCMEEILPLRLLYFVAESLNAKLEKNNSCLHGKLQNLRAWLVSIKELGWKPVSVSERTTAIQPNLATQLFLGSCFYDLLSKFFITFVQLSVRKMRYLEKRASRLHVRVVSGVNCTVAKSIPFTQYFHLHLIPQACVLVLIWTDSSASLWETDFQSSLLSF